MLLHHTFATGRQLTAVKPGCLWWRRGPKTVITQRIRDPLITVHGILDPWCQQQYNYYDHLISFFLLWCLFNSHGPKTLWLLLTPSQGCVLFFCYILTHCDSCMKKYTTTFMFFFISCVFYILCNIIYTSSDMRRNRLFVVDVEVAS
jgi:hypothetical protein